MSFLKFEEFFESLGLILLISLVFIAAVLRLVGIDMSWSTDMAQLTFAWVCFIGGDLALRNKKHIGVDLLVNVFPERLRITIRFINSLIIICFLAAVIVYGVNLCIINYQRCFNTLQISYSFVTASVPVGCALMFATGVQQTAGYWKQLFTVKKKEVKACSC